MKNTKLRRSDCQINFALETFGDMWSLLIVRDIVYYGKKTYGEFLDSEEGIATNILASRLAQLEQKGILDKKPCDTDRRKDIYSLTDRGLDLIPVLLEMARWSARHDPQCSAHAVWIEMLNTDQSSLVRLVCDTVQRGGSIFSGPDCLIK
jgi:DNA-binding HxlR family transcriptional regulator